MMNADKHNDADWMAKLRDSLDGFETAPPDGLWDNINSALRNTASEQETKASGWKKHALGYVAAASVALLGCIAGMLLLTSDDERAKVLAEVEKVNEEIVSKPAKPKECISSDVNEPLAKGTQQETFLSHIAEEQEGHTYSCTSPTDTVVYAPSATSPSVVATHTPTNDHTPNQESHRIVSSLSKKDSRLAVAIVSQLTPSSLQMVPQFSMNNYASKQRKAFSLLLGAYGAEKKVEHRVSEQIGALIHYRLEDNYSLETGILFSTLESTFTTTSEYVSIRDIQKLHMIGVPIGVSHNEWKNGGFEISVGAGATIEKCIRGTYESELYGNIRTSRPWQFSMNANASIEYKLNNHIGVFAQEALSYYFDNKSSVETIYDRKPFMPVTRLGVKVTLDGKH